MMLPWSDGTPVTSADLVFTFEGQMKNENFPIMLSSISMFQEVKAVDEKTAVITFKIPAHASPLKC